jgi:predicted adenine nucleotide alpha hydrolase (AANH) superfamily ATPase
MKTLLSLSASLCFLWICHSAPMAMERSSKKLSPKLSQSPRQTSQKIVALSQSRGSSRLKKEQNTFFYGDDWKKEKIQYLIDSGINYYELSPELKEKYLLNNP